eukprot:CAMPEP_0184686800 /NCGR_PEP_ID=MMETSP0312-20130426/24108_1 /TAXON_ID=31354 /ORGANISM="Compsopogon coeruleus, Strain SAG 36.94" /LENGTH=94 /DNA_ID=CAMNT_0027142287 /DNA_START=207 /DNA_END=487 /DNA_ORIENTATION=+
MPSGGKCSLHIVILNRSPNVTARYLANVGDVTEELNQLNICGVNVSHEVKQFDSEPFNAQAETMQRADILVSVHGAEMTNVVFLRKDSHVIEIS